MRWLAGTDVCGDEGCLPCLDDVVFARLGIGFEDDEFAVGKKAESTALDGGGDALGDEIVTEQEVG